MVRIIRQYIVVDWKMCKETVVLQNTLVNYDRYYILLIVLSDLDFRKHIV